MNKQCNWCKEFKNIHQYPVIFSRKKYFGKKIIKTYDVCSVCMTNIDFRTKEEIEKEVL